MSNKKKVVIANDHGAVELKKQIIKHLEGRDYEVVNLGINEETSVDYPDMARRAADEYKKGGYEFGVLCCGTGIGIAISACKIREIRCATVVDSFAAEMTKRHNDANFLAFGGRIKYPESVEKMLDAYIDAEYEGGRHARRVQKMMDLELEDTTVGYC